MKDLPTSPRGWKQFILRGVRFYRSADVPNFLKVATVLLCAGYLILPIDLVPDFLPFIGEVDDVTIVVLIHMAIVGWAQQHYAVDLDNKQQTIDVS